MEEQEYIIGMCGGEPIFGYPTDASEDTVSYSYKDIEDEPVLVPTQKLSKVLSTLHTLIAKLGKPFSGSYNDLTDKPTIPKTKSDIGLSNVDNTSDASKHVDYANTSGRVASRTNGDWFLDMAWDGTFFQTMCRTDNGSTLPMRVKRAEYAESAGSAPANGGRSSTCETSDNTNYTNYVGSNALADGKVTMFQTSEYVWGQNDWGSYLCFAHGNPYNYYHHLVKFPFWGAPKYHRLEGGTDRGWYEFITTENVHNHKAGSANRADYTENPNDNTLVQTTNGVRLQVQRDGNMVLCHNWNNAVWQTGTSSLRFKKNVNDITEERAKKILDIRVRTFDYKENQVCATGLYDKVGVIAEEVSPIMRDVVIFDKVDDDGNVRETEYNVDYQGFVPYLIKMVQMQQEEINELKARLDKLEKGE